MNRFLTILACGGILLIPAYADVMSVAGSTSGQFTNITGSASSNANTWSDLGGHWSVAFNGISFNGNTPNSFNFGSIVLAADQDARPGTSTADLDVTIDFSTPNYQQVQFADTLQLITTVTGNHSKQDLALDFTALPLPAKSFTVGSETYTVTYDGFFDGASNALTDLIVNGNRGSATAYLWGTITAVDPPGAVPEPASVLLLGTLIAGALYTYRRHCIH